MIRSLVRHAPLLMVAISGTAFAHDSWLEPKTFHAQPGTPVPLTFFVGHHGEQRATALKSKPAWLLAMRRDGPGGSLNLLNGQEFNRASMIRFPSAGTHMISLATASFKHQMKPAEFPAYMKEEGLAGAEAAWARSPVRGRNVREEYRRYAKSLVQVGTAMSDKSMTRRVGHDLEIVPAVNPYLLSAGQPLKATVWHSSRPLTGALVTLGSLDRPKDPLIEARSDAAGNVSFDMPDKGRWMMNVVWSVPSNAPGIDYQTSFSSLTFSAPHRR